MAARFKAVVSGQKIYESLWHAPPAFLAPCLRSPFSTSSPVAATLQKTKRRIKKQRENRPKDAYALRQAKARKEANLSRQAVLREERVKQLGDPIRGIETDFVKSFDIEVPQAAEKDTKAVDQTIEPVIANPDKPPPSPAFAAEEKHLDHGLTHPELEKALEFSRHLTSPLPADPDSPNYDPEAARREQQLWEARNASASEAVQRIVSLANGSSLHRTKANIARLIHTFGRHNTDQTLKPKATAPIALAYPGPVHTPRVGPDTGSSEVQIGILTAKIRVLADRYEGENRNDKINKRNLRLLLHRRQKLLRYMEKKERGSERWSHMLEKLGLTEANWKGEIAVQ